MAWNNTGCRINQSQSVSTVLIAQKQLSYEVGIKEPYGIKEVTVSVYGKSTQTTTTIRGLSYDGALAMVNADGATHFEMATYTKVVYQGSPRTVTTAIDYEKRSKNTSMRRVDNSGQYEVEIVETSTGII